MRFHTARHAWTEVHTQYGLGLLRDFGLLDSTGKTPMLYCPSCHARESLKDAFGEGGARVWRCDKCQATCKRPAVLAKKGAITATQTNSGLRDNDWRIVDGMEAGRILSVIEKLPAECRAFGTICYTDNGTAHDERIVLEYGIDRYDAREGKKAATLGEIVKILELIQHLIADTAQRFRNGRGKYTDYRLAEMLGVDRSEFVPTRAWGRRKSIIVEVLDDIDRRALQPVAEAIERLREGEMKQGQAMGQTWTGTPEWPGDELVTMSPGGPGELIGCLKCGDCVRR